MNLAKRILFGLVLETALVGSAGAADFLSAGPLYDQFYLTLAPGERTEAAGPLFYQEQRETQHTWAVPPLISYTTDAATQLKEFDILYPVLTYDRYGEQYRWQFFQLLAFAGGPMQDQEQRRRFTLFPLYFQQRSTNPSENYTAVVPFYGHLKHRLFKDEMFFVMFPFYGQTRKKDVITDNYVYPFFHLRHGAGLYGWQFWPITGHEHKEVTTITNGFNEVQSVPGHDSFFVLWPIYFNDHTGLGTDNPVWRQGALPFYALERSPKRNSTTVLWPFFNRIDDQDKKYREWDFPWPLWEIARGEGKTTTRFWPIVSHAKTPTLESDFYLWPVYKYNAAHLPPLDRERTRIFFFLYSDTRDKNAETGAFSRRTYLWPFFTKRRDLDGNTRLQVLALLEPFMEGSHKIARDWSPVWSLWRSEQNPKTAAASQSLLWNLYRRDRRPDYRKVSVFFGLYQREVTPAGKRTKLFHIPLSKAPTPAPDQSQNSPAAAKPRE